MRGEWIEIRNLHPVLLFSTLSLPMRGEWIEISTLPPIFSTKFVSPHAGRVD